jgi:peptidoglycan-N-acetylglucosamine deacetylase
VTGIDRELYASGIVRSRPLIEARSTSTATVSVLVLVGCAQVAQPRSVSAASGVPTSTVGSPGGSATPEPGFPPRVPGSTGDVLPPVVNHGLRTGHQVALTFDADMTTQMLAKLASGQAQSYANLKVIQLLEDGSVPATFFITGMWAQRYPDVMRRLAANPNFEFGNHTWSHRAYTPNCYTLGQLPPAEMAPEIQRTFDLVRSFGGRQTHFFRFPGLCYNTAALAAIAPEQVTVIQGDVISGDPLATAWQPIVRAVLDHVQPGSIVVLHITQDNARMTDKALPPILEGLRAKGLQPVRLSQLLAT